MICDVARCGSHADHRVDFRTGGSYYYCHWHTFRGGQLRWKQLHVSGVSRAS